jgi:hypothetical protein
MHSLKKSCLRWGLLYVFLGLGLSALVYLRLPQTGLALGWGFGAAILVWFAIGYVFGIRTRNEEARMMRRGMSGERPNDGDKIAVVGTIGSSFDTLESPMTRQRCVAYEYKGIPPSAQDAAVIEGFALTPATIEGPRGAIRLLAVPELDFPFDSPSRIEFYDNFSEYIEQTQFLQHFGIDIKREMAHLKTVVADDDGRIRYDIKRDPSINVSTLQMKEKILAPGARVVAVGRYSAAKNALVPDETAMLHAVKITTGEPSAIAKRGCGKGVFELFLGCGCLLPVIAGALLGLALMPLDAIEQQFAKKDPSWPEVKAERWVQRNVRPRLGSMISQGEPVIELEYGQARGKLTVNGKTVPLTRSRVRPEGDVYEITLLSDQNEGVIARVRNDRTIESLHVIGGEAFNVAGASLDRWAAHDTVAVGLLTALSPGDGPKVRAYFRAHAEAPQ